MQVVSSSWCSQASGQKRQVVPIPKCLHCTELMRNRAIPSGVRNVFLVPLSPVPTATTTTTSQNLCLSSGTKEQATSQRKDLSCPGGCCAVGRRVHWSASIILGSAKMLLHIDHPTERQPTELMLQGIFSEWRLTGCSKAECKALMKIWGSTF